MQLRTRPLYRPSTFTIDVVKELHVVTIQLRHDVGIKDIRMFRHDFPCDCWFFRLLASSFFLRHVARANSKNSVHRAFLFLSFFLKKKKKRVVVESPGRVSLTPMKKQLARPDPSCSLLCAHFWSFKKRGVF